MFCIKSEIKEEAEEIKLATEWSGFFFFFFFKTSNVQDGLFSKIGGFIYVRYIFSLFFNRNQWRHQKQWMKSWYILHLLSHAMDEKLIHGVGFNRNALTFLHLLFVNNSLIFAKATSEVCSSWNLFSINSWLHQDYQKWGKWYPQLIA